MIRILHIALREFTATALTKGFIIGGIIVPLVLVAVLAFVMPRLMNEDVPSVVGTVAVIDQTETLETAIRERFTPDAIEAWQAQRRGETAERVEEATRQATDTQSMLEASEKVAKAMQELDTTLTIEMLEPRVDEQSLKAAKDPLTKGESLQDGGRMALVIIDPNAVERSGENNEFGGFQIFTRPKLDDRVVDLIRDQVRSAIRTTRITAAGYSPDEFDALNSVVQRRTQEVTATGEERGALGELNMLLQFAFMFLMMMSVFVSGQYLLTTTIEEKSSRVVELLLSSASPMSLMAGKIFGQMGVGLFLIMVYGSLGFVGLLIASMVDIISPMMIVWFFCFYFVAYTIIASLMAAVGSAVNDLREAQSLMTPVMMIIMLPYILWLPISRDPNSTFATIASFIPGVNPFVLILRLTSTEPPPTWQVAVGLIIGIASAYAAVWVAAKVFRVGLLMFGKPPSYATLWRWIRMA